MGERTSITAYDDDLETLNRAKRQLQADLDEDLAMREALVIWAQAYLAGDLDVDR